MSVSCLNDPTELVSVVKEVDQLAGAPRADRDPAELVSVVKEVDQLVSRRLAGQPPSPPGQADCRFSLGVLTRYKELCIL